MDTYLIKNITDIWKEVDNSDRSPFISQLDRDDRKNELLLIRQRKLMESNSCKIRRFLIVVQFNDDYTTQLNYVSMVQFWDLVSNIGQSISVYLGLCLYDFHKLVGFFFDLFSVYRDGGELMERMSGRPRKNRFDSLMNSNLGRKLSRRLSIRLDDRTALNTALNTNFNRNSTFDNINKDQKELKVYNLNDLNQQDTLSQKIRTFDTIQDQFKFINRNHNLQSINKDLLNKFNYNRQLNNQLSPFNPFSIRNNVLNESNYRFNNLQNGNLYKLYPITEQNQSTLLNLIERKKLNGKDGKKVKHVQLNDQPSLIYVDDYLFNVINLHKKGNLNI